MLRILPKFVRSEFARVLLSALRGGVVCGAAALSLSGCSSGAPVDVVHQPLSVRVRLIENSVVPPPLSKGEVALTTWEFGCRPAFEFDTVDDTFLGRDYMATVSISKVRVLLSAPVVVWISKSAPVSVREHEKAHVLILRHVYEEADAAARKAAEQVLGRRFQGSGATIEAACADAVSHASAELCDVYHGRVSASAEQISETFDLIDSGNAAKGKHPPVGKMLEQAFESAAGAI